MPMRRAALRGLVLAQRLVDLPVTTKLDGFVESEHHLQSHLLTTIKSPSQAALEVE